jgi:uncharacterized protein YecT (DUF1311 family)
MTILFLLLFLGCSTPSQKPSCYDTASTQLALSECARDESSAADKQLNIAYKQVMIKFGDDSVFKVKLKKAQRAWIAYRDLEMELASPGGSVSSMCVGIRLTQLNKERAEFLKSLAEKEEGDVCAP